MAKNLNDLIEEIKVANQTQLIESQLSAAVDPTRQVRQALRKRDNPRLSILYSGLPRAFNSKSGKPRFSIEAYPEGSSPWPHSFTPTPEKKDPQTYNWSPVTTMESGLTIPYLYGKMKTKGNIITGHLGGTNNSQDQQLMSCVVGLCKGPIESFESATLNGFPLFSDSTFTPTAGTGTNSRGGFDFRYGWNYQPPFSNLNDAYTNIPANDIPVHYGAPVLITQDMTGYDDVWIYLKFPEGMYYQPESSGDLQDQSCLVTVESRLTGSGGWWLNYQGIITNKMRVPFRYYIRVFPDWSPQGAYYPPFANSTYDIRVTKVCEDFNLIDNKAVNAFVVEYLTAGVRDDFTYPGIACFGVFHSATETLNGTLDLSLVIKGRKVRVYSNTTTYVLQWSDNPAWVCLDVLNQPVWDNASYSWDGYKYNPSVFSLNREDGIPISQIDIQSFIDWAAWCDGTVIPPAYDPTDTKRCTFNGIFDSTINIWDAAKSIADNARAWLLPPSGTSKYKVILDRPATVTQIFTSANIIEGSLEESYTSMQDRANSLQIDFYNKDDDWGQETFNVVYTEADVIREDSKTLFGITCASQAWRRAMLQLYYNAVTTVEVQFNVGQDALNCEIGDVIGVSHELPQWGYGGRIVSATGSTVILDRPVSISANTPYQLAVRNSNDVLTIFNIPSGANAENPAATVLNGTFSPVPAQYDPFAFGAWFGNKQYKPFRVMEIKDNGDDSFHLVCQEYNESVYNVDTMHPPIATPNYSSLDAFPDVTNLVLDEILILKQDGGIIDCINVYFNRPTSSVYAKADIYYCQLIGVSPANWIFSGSTDKENYRIENVLVGVTYRVAVVTVNTSGRKSDLSTAPSQDITTIGKANRPSNVTNFWIVQSGPTLIFTWDHIEDSDLWGYEIRIGWSFASSDVIVDLHSANRYDYPAELDGTYRFWLSAVDTSGNYSLNPVALDFTVSGVDDTRNFILDIDAVQTYHASWETIYNWTWVPTGHFFTWSPS